jgi:hypothetical protein
LCYFPLSPQSLLFLLRGLAGGLAGGFSTITSMSGAGSLPPPSSSTFPAAAADQARDRWQQALQSQVDHFWEERLKEATEIEAKDIKCSCELPLARVKRVMKLEDELQVRGV